MYTRERRKESEQILLSNKSKLQIIHYWGTFEEVNGKIVEVFDVPIRTKFVVSYSPTENNIYVSIGGNDHANIKYRLEVKKGPLVNGGGGYFEVIKSAEGFNVVFSGQSGSLGKYNKKVLLYFKDFLTEHLKNKLAASNVLLEIKASKITR